MPLLDSPEDPESPVLDGSGFSFGPLPIFGATGTAVGGEYYNAYAQPSIPMAHSLSAQEMTINPSDMHISPSTSGVMTCQSTPQTDLNESPYAASYKASPAWKFTDSPLDYPNNFDFEQSEPTGQMFPDLDGQDYEEMVSTHVEKQAVAMSQKGSSPGKASPNVRLSLLAGVNKKKKNRGPLPDIEVNSNDPKEIKKARNTLAARKSRDRKEERTKLLVEECEKRAEEAEALRRELETSRLDAEAWKERAFRAGWRSVNE
ncbi:MAG: hypothetical protein Q9210_007528 [Variospora velana]